MTLAAILAAVISFALGALLALLTIPVLVWLERRVAGLVQDRLGPNRTNIGGFRLGGVVQSFADVVKLLLKEEYYPSHIKNGKWLFMLAPIITFAAALLAFMAIPFADTLIINNESLRIQPLPIDFGVFWYLAISSIGVLGVIFGGWLSHNKYSLLGAARAGSMVVSYELPLGLSILAFIITYDTIDFNAMVAWQSGTFFGFLPAWGILVQPLASIILIVALFAETNRNPFTVAEGESEIVAGFMTEYTAMKFAMYFMGEYVAMNTASAVIITMIFGGYQIPWVSTQMLLENFSTFSITLMIIVPVIVSVLVRWMQKNNRVRPSVSTDGGRNFETKVLTLAMIGMTLVVEAILIYLVFLAESSLANSITVALFQVVVFVVKLMIFNIFFILIRWTVPRFRYDQVQHLGWYYLLPLALINIFITALVVVGVSL
ncbi:MAG: NADH-quinone oxidoreductase subunit H [Sulfurimonas sp.]|nr:NADH-quinone oxidoreductase subunit H [Sulfurimonas sp.]MBU3939957.1 NADH-quinone oxidoreductase subunit H [bacterium]MBU4024072.1 NADH-quinone oxidoreductase subunit H [bacterium]MBU4059632.1 NADH-quinone oxidoreductase subunit H [bacterium]MBU4111545.1 NADH-quinone oxidoreductase subunit H [bacterium]